MDIVDFHIRAVFRFQYSIWRGSRHIENTQALYIISYYLYIILLLRKPLPLYADDTQLFLSFLPTHFDSSIDHLHNALDRISSWMTANLLTLNASKTEFLLIGLSKQLAKINNPGKWRTGPESKAL